MAKKDTTSTVLSMLGDRGAALRPPVVERAPAQRPAPAAEDVAPGPEAAIAVDSSESTEGSGSARPAATARRARKQPAPAPPADPAQNAPRTLRLSQTMANTLRAAWLEAKREDVLLTYQDFADQVVKMGLRRR